MAVRQWEAIEERRRALVLATFPAVELSDAKCRSTDAAPVNIRPGTAADAAALAAFAARTFAETFAADSTPADMEEHLARAYGVAQQTAELTDPHGRPCSRRRPGSWSATRRCAAPHRPPASTAPDSSELHRFYVDRAAHGTGVAQR